MEAGSQAGQVRRDESKNLSLLHISSTFDRYYDVSTTDKLKKW